MKGELPSWSTSGEGIRDALLSIPDGEVDSEEVSDSISSAVVDSLRNLQADGNRQSPQIAYNSNTCGELERIFCASQSASDSRTQVALARAAKDMALVRLRLCSEAASSDQSSRHTTSSRNLPEFDVLPKLEALSGQWSIPAQQLSSMWTTGSQSNPGQPMPGTSQISSSQFSRSLKRRSDQSQAMAGSSNISSQRAIPSSFLSGRARIAPLAHTPSEPMDAFAMMSQSLTQTGRSQPLPLNKPKKKTRKSGF
ncbi:hypothetical protein H4S07_004361 [Coemansia furcata]|uniref:Uncharacterized protein n=1 Tax=Coemansia furcata TaxID=417177 RepID=A0ACC1L927_9FUNG|nr:hypothetical protein H4S07_004361 [Coemansia furcata]